jgi:UDP-N-acetylglucosamine acyltransferase
MISVASTVVVGKNVTLGQDVTVGHYAVIGDGVAIGKGTTIGPHAVIGKGTAIGNHCVIDCFVAIGGNPQYASFDTTLPTGVVIGDRTVIREHPVIHRSTRRGDPTVVGKDCMVQTNVHIAHGGKVGDNTILANGSMVGGDAAVGSYCFIGGGAAIDQDVKVGDFSILRGNSATALHIPPYTIGAGESTVVGINAKTLVQMKVLPSCVALLKFCFSEFYRRTGTFKQRAIAMLGDGYGSSLETKNFLTFFSMDSKRGFARLRKGTHLS